jgi:hypothetical protein
MPGELIPIVLFISVAAVAIFRPLTKRIGSVIEQSYADRKAAAPDPRFDRMVQLMERLVDRIDRLEERVDFQDRLLERTRAQAQLPNGAEHERPNTEGADSAARARSPRAP